MAFIKSEKNGQWYPDHTNWNYVHDALCDALAYFSESDLRDKFYIIIDRVADDIYQNFVKL